MAIFNSNSATVRRVIREWEQQIDRMDAQHKESYRKLERQFNENLRELKGKMDAQDREITDLKKKYESSLEKLVVEHKKAVDELQARMLSEINDLKSQMEEQSREMEELKRAYEEALERSRNDFEDEKRRIQAIIENYEEAERRMREQFESKYRKVKKMISDARKSDKEISMHSHGYIDVLEQAVDDEYLSATSDEYYYFAELVVKHRRLNNLAKDVADTIEDARKIHEAHVAMDVLESRLTEYIRGDEVSGVIMAVERTPPWADIMLEYHDMSGTIVIVYAAERSFDIDVIVDADDEDYIEEVRQSKIREIGRFYSPDGGRPRLDASIRREIESMREDDERIKRFMKRADLNLN